MEHYMKNANDFYVKINVHENEWFIQKYLEKLNNKNIPVPEIIEYNGESKIMVMKKIGNNNLSHNYGENARDVPDELFKQVVTIVRNLVLNNVEYPDLTGYNFVEDTDGKVSIIDFGHARIKNSEDILKNIHIQNICNGYKIWNPDFK
jgi:tRNA A-37 threonylcarbamoyl transferase component Bud32|tara:strand:- start:4052 stop:4495 length:444 start_codon:yes stop_codon:yes gene_type:complete